METRIKRCKDLLRDSPPGLPVGPEESEGQNPPASLQGLLLGVHVCSHVQLIGNQNLDFGKA